MNTWRLGWERMSEKGGKLIYVHLPYQEGPSNLYSF